MDDIINFIRQQPTKKFQKDEIIIQQHESPRELYGIRSGFVKVSDISSEGNEQLIWLAKKFDVIPVEWLFDSSDSSPFFYTAHTDVEVFAVPKDIFLEKVSNNSASLLQIAHSMAGKHLDLLMHIRATQKPKARDKIVHTLYYLSRRLAETEPDGRSKLTLPLTHMNIANLVGITRETASLELKILKDEGYVDYNKKDFLIYTHKLSQLMNET